MLEEHREVDGFVRLSMRASRSARPVGLEVRPVLRVLPQLAELATTAHGVREGVLMLDDCLRVVENRMRPACPSTEHVAVREVPARHQLAEVNVTYASAEDVQHMGVDGFESNHDEGPTGINALFVWNRDLWAGVDIRRWRVELEDRPMFWPYTIR